MSFINHFVITDKFADSLNFETVLVTQIMSFKSHRQADLNRYKFQCSMQTFWLHYFTDSNVSSPEPVQISGNNWPHTQLGDKFH